MITYRLRRSQVVKEFTCDEFAYYRAADELGLWPDPIVEVAKLRATITAMLSSSRRTVALSDFLPDVLVPSAPNPEADARAMESFTAGYKALKGK